MKNRRRENITGLYKFRIRKIRRKDERNCRNVYTYYRESFGVLKYVLETGGNKTLFPAMQYKDRKL